MRSKKNGFTLVELLAVIVILALIMILAIPAILRVMNEARREGFYLYTRSLESKAMARYQQDIQMLGDTNDNIEACRVYDISEDFDLSNTGDYHGYVKMVRTPKSNGQNKHSIGLGNGSNVITGVHYCTYKAGSARCTPDKSISIDWEAQNLKSYRITQTLTDELNKDGSIKAAFYLCANYDYVTTEGGRKVIKTSTTKCTANGGGDGSIEAAGNTSFDYSMYMSIASRSYVITNIKYDENMTQNEFYDQMKQDNSVAESAPMVDCDGQTGLFVTLQGNNAQKVTLVTDTNKTSDPTKTQYVTEGTTKGTSVQTVTNPNNTSSGRQTEIVDTTTTSERQSQEAVSTDRKTTETITVTTKGTTTTSNVVVSSNSSNKTNGVTNVTSSGSRQTTDIIVSSKSTQGTETSVVSDPNSPTTRIITVTTRGTQGTGTQNVTQSTTTATSIQYITNASGAVVSSQVVTITNATSVGTTGVDVATTEEPRYQWVNTTEPAEVYDDILLASLSVTPYNLTEEFTPYKYYYTVTVPYSTRSVTISAIPMQTDGTVDVFVNDTHEKTVSNLKVGNNQITVKTHDSKNGKVLYYRINVDRLQESGDTVNTVEAKTTSPGSGAHGAPDPSIPQSNANLKKLTVFDQDIKFDPNVTEYQAYLPSGQKELLLSYETASPGAHAYEAGNTDLHTGSEITITVKSENGYYEKIYRIKITDQKVSAVIRKWLIPLIALLLFAILAVLLYMWWRKGHTLIASRDEDESENGNSNQYVPDQAQPQEIAKR